MPLGSGHCPRHYGHTCQRYAATVVVRPSNGHENEETTPEKHAIKRRTESYGHQTTVVKFEAALLQ
jgi:ribosomal protein L44E